MRLLAACPLDTGVGAHSQSPQHLIVPAPGLCEDVEVACYCPSSPRGCTLRGHNREQNR